MLRLKTLSILESKEALSVLPEGKLLINTINAHSYNTALKDKAFAEALTKGDVLIPDGASIVKACRWLKTKSRPEERIAGWDLFVFEMNKLNSKGGKCFFMGSSPKVLNLIKERAAVDYPNITVETYSPPYKPEFSKEDNRAIIKAINRAKEYCKGKGKDLKIEIEVRNFDELQQVLDLGGVDRIMFDNFTPAMTKKAVEMVGGRYETESSGGITFDTLRDYAECGVDFISVGALTHSVKGLDMSFKAC
jgi:exopolysaccharide biosynthesis WecB/TagA/CpsF family protein